MTVSQVVSTCVARKRTGKCSGGFQTSIGGAKEEWKAEAFLYILNPNWGLSGLLSKNNDENVRAGFRARA